MARNRGTHHVSCVKHGDWTQTSPRVAGAGTGTPATPVALMQSGVYRETAGHTREVSVGGDSVVTLGIVERVATFGGIVKAATLVGKAFRPTSMVTDQQFLTFLLANDMGFGTTLTDAWIKTLKLSMQGRDKALVADYEVWALREAAGSYAAQGASSGAGAYMGAELSTATLEGAAIDGLMSWEFNLDNAFAWDDDVVVAASGDELEHVDFLNPMPEVVTARLVCSKPIAAATTYLKKKTLVKDLDLVFTWTVGAHTGTLTLNECFATAQESTLGPPDAKYQFSLDITGAATWGSAVWTTT